MHKQATVRASAKIFFRDCYSSSFPTTLLFPLYSGTNTTFSAGLAC